MSKNLRDADERFDWEWSSVKWGANQHHFTLGSLAVLHHLTLLDYLWEGSETRRERTGLPVFPDFFFERRGSLGERFLGTGVHLTCWLSGGQAVKLEKTKARRYAK